MNRHQNTIDGIETAFASAARVLLGLLLIGVGVVTFFVPGFRAAFVGQLDAAGLPLAQMSRFAIPMVEAVAGLLLMRGVLIRIASLASILVTAFLTYLGLVVEEPALFPPQVGLPLIPIVALVLSIFLYFVESHGDEI